MFLKSIVSGTPFLTMVAREIEGPLQAAQLMRISARTAPKSGRVDDVVTANASGKERDLLAIEVSK